MIKLHAFIGNDVEATLAFATIMDALKQAGFDVISSKDCAPESDPETPWHLPLSAKVALAGFKRSQGGRWFTHRLVKVLEAARIAPKGSVNVSTMLNNGADALVRGGETGIFTPMFFFHVRKPAGPHA